MKPYAPTSKIQIYWQENRPWGTNIGATSLVKSIFFWAEIILWHIFCIVYSKYKRAKWKKKTFFITKPCREPGEVTRISLQTHLEEKCICERKTHKLKLVLILWDQSLCSLASSFGCCQPAVSEEAEEHCSGPMWANLPLTALLMMWRSNWLKLQNLTKLNIRIFSALRTT